MTIPISLLRAAQTRANKPAIHLEGRIVTWAEEVDRVRRLASGLLAQGLRPGDRLAILAANVREHMEITYAAVWAGIVIVPLNTRLAAAELADIIRRSGSRMLAYDSRNAAQATEIAGGVETLIALEPDALRPGATAFDTLLAADPAPLVDHEASDLYGIYYTGGTTGVPKGVELEHGTNHISTLGILHEVGYREDDVYLHAAPYFHLADCGLGNAMTYAGGSHVFLPEANPQTILAAIRTHGVTAMMSVPTGFHDLLNALEPGEALTRIRQVVYGAAPVPLTLLRRIIAAFPNARLTQFYGQTESNGMFTCLRPEDHGLDSKVLNTVGRAIPTAHVRIADPDGNELPRGQTGEIQVKGYSVMRGYKDDPERTAAAFVDGWLRTGDAGAMDEDGYVTMADRIKDMIVSGGENVFSGEVEAALLGHPAVAQVAVVGIPDERWGEAVHAAVILSPGATADQAELNAYVRRHIAGYKCPKSYSFVTSLPLSAVGKIRKDVLRAELIDATDDAS